MTFLIATEEKVCFQLPLDEDVGLSAPPEHSLPVQYLLPLSYLEILGALFGGGEGRGWSAECEQN